MILLLLLQGIAAEHAGDEGIENDPRVLFVEDFETGDVKAARARWGQAEKMRNMSLVPEVHAASPGRRSLRIVDNGHLMTRTRGVDTMFARFYVRFHPKIGYVHHFVHLMADRYPTPWPKGGAGNRPAGDRRFTTGIEPQGAWGKFPPPGKWGFYSYWHEMKGRGPGQYWGNVFRPDAQDLIPAGRWICMEVMLKANSAPDAADGEQAFWVDGEKVGHFRGIRWRTHEAVKPNSMHLLFYNTGQPARHNRDRDAASRVFEVWFDDIVLATEYIGPVKGRPKNGTKAAGPVKPRRPKLPEKVIFRESFDGGTGKFKGGEARDGAVACPPKQLTVWGAWSTPVKETTTVRFRAKPLDDVGAVTILSWSKEIGDNGRYYVTRLRKGEWQEVRFRAADLRAGMERDGKSVAEGTFNNLTLTYEGGTDARILIDDFEIRE